MYSTYLQEYVRSLSSLADVPPEQIDLLNESLGSFLATLAHVTLADIEPSQDLLVVTVRLLMMSDALSRFEGASDPLRDSHHLVAMGFEQTSVQLARRASLAAEYLSVSPLENDHFYRLLLSYLHYLCAGSRVQATAVLRQLRAFTDSRSSEQILIQYSSLVNELQVLFTGVGQEAAFQRSTEWETLLSGTRQALNTQERRISRLSRQIRERRQVVLDLLGRTDPETWLASRGLHDHTAVDFWLAYLERLIMRGITAFTPEQIGPGFDQWLIPDRNLAVMLPTGSGKSIVGELLTALELAGGSVVIWLLPTRALVRQVRRDLRSAFRGLDVRVEELPITEDYAAVFEDNIPTQRYVAVSTPEKLQALLRQQPESIRSVTLAVVDEAQLLFDSTRGAALESVLHTLVSQAPTCKLAVMTAFPDRFQSLLGFLSTLQPDVQVATLHSQIRPTRRINGIATSSQYQGSGYAKLMLFPAGLQAENGTTQNPFKIHMHNVIVPDSARTKRTEIGSRVTRGLTRASIRTVLFVRTRESTETQARKIVTARSRLPSIQLRNRSVSRLRIELGRESAIEQSAHYRVAPHHAGMTSLEQHVVETWLACGDINTVVATPTLAQGVNLPFDAAILTFVSRYNLETQRDEELDISELQNMLGRAGRAGQVSDGICLVAASRSFADDRRDLDSNRRYFFSQLADTTDAYGMHSLMLEALSAQVNRPAWIEDLGDTSFASAMALLTDTSNLIPAAFDPTFDFQNYLALFPSLAYVDPILRESVATTIRELTVNLNTAIAGDSLLLAALQQTGMPIELLRYFLNEIRATFSVDATMSGSEATIDTNWMDAVVQGGLEHCLPRAWLIQLLLPANDGAATRWNPHSVVRALQLWRAGATIAKIEEDVTVQVRNKSIEIGVFLNQRASQFAQFWGALSVCYQLYREQEGVADLNLSEIRYAQTYIREGVQNLTQLLWLRRLGGLDRVLAHRLADVSVVQQDIGSINRFIRGQLDLWRSSPDTIPSILAEDERYALEDILDELT